MRNASSCRNCIDESRVASPGSRGNHRLPVAVAASVAVSVTVTETETETETKTVAVAVAVSEAVLGPVNSAPHRECQVRYCAGTTTRNRGAPRTIPLPGSHGKRFEGQLSRLRWRPPARDQRGRRLPNQPALDWRASQAEFATPRSALTADRRGCGRGAQSALAAPARPR